MQESPSAIPVMRTPRTVDLEITSHCNLRCKYCYFFDNPEVSYHELPTVEWLKFIDDLGQCAVMDVCLAGGEPFMREDLPELLEAVVKNRMRFSILSNGTLIDDTIAEFIAATKNSPIGCSILSALILFILQVLQNHHHQPNHLEVK